MKKTLLATVMVIATGFSGALLADDHGKAGDRHEKYMQHMTKTLDLSTEQQTQLKAIHETHGEQYRALREQHKNEVNALLNADQQAKLAEMREQKREKMAERWKDGKKKQGDKAQGSN
ncbi:MAG: hypothetical protein V7751_08040 [Pseudoalteromonas distincta]